MRTRVLLLALSVLVLGATVPFLGQSGSADPLFINMTTDDGHRSLMAIGYGANQFRRGHGLTVFCNDKGVFVASQATAAAYPEQQKMLKELAAAGATILVCPTCMAHYGVQEDDLLPGLAVSTPESTGAALFQDGTRTLSW